MITAKQINSLTKAIDRFNANLAAYQNASGETELPYVDCTCCGCSIAKPYYYELFKDNRLNVKDIDGNQYTVTDEEGLAEVKESLRYDKRRLAKAWRVFKSDNPDWELEHDTDENE